jgi:hypothetical protein
MPTHMRLLCASEEPEEIIEKPVHRVWTGSTRISSRSEIRCFGIRAEERFTPR